MELTRTKLVVISHASIKQINRAVYRYLKNSLLEVRLVVPVTLTLGSGQTIHAEPATHDDPTIEPLALSGKNPRAYSYPDLIDYLNRVKPQVVLLENDPVSKLGFQMSAWCRRNGAKLICQTYENLKRDIKTSLSLQGWTGMVKNLAIHILNARMAKRVDALLVVNRDSELIFNQYGYNNVFRIPLGYDPQVFFPDGSVRSAYRKKLNVAEGSILIAYFGRLVKQKGVHLLIEALQEIRHLDWTLLLDHIHDSEDDYVSYITTLINDCGLSNRVIYFEADHFEIANYMRAADILVAPSLTTPSFKEQYGRAVQEGMASGCVCIVSDSGHLKDLVGTDELVFKEGNSQQLRKMIVKYSNDEAARTRIQYFLIQRASSLFTTTRQSDALITLIEKLNRTGS
jgi:glycosyltransferase involved in cell wall biosynthesis